MAELTLFDDMPDDVPATGTPATVYGHRENIDHGHLLIQSGMGDWMFVYTGSDTVRCSFPGWATGIDLTADQLQVVGEYGLRMAERCRR